MYKKQKNKIPVEATPLNDKKQWLFTVLFIIIAVSSISIVALQSQDFSFSGFLTAIKESDWRWLLVAFGSMLSFIAFEALAILSLCKALGYKMGFWKGYIYSASDIYFSALTPSATGGQPASAYFMIKNGIDGIKATAILIANVATYILSMVVIGILCLIFRFDIFLSFSTISQTLIIFGLLIHLGLVIFFYLLLKRERLLHRICSFFINLLCKIKIFRNKEKKLLKLEIYMKNYRKHCDLIVKHKKALFLCFIFNFLQRTAQIAITMFVHIAITGEKFLEAINFWFMQGYVTLGANIIPIPGAMGVSDGMMLDAFTSVMERSQATNLELLSRSFSFYGCVIICGVSTLIGYCLLKKRGK